MPTIFIIILDARLILKLKLELLKDCFQEYHSRYIENKTADFKARLKTHQTSHVDNIKVVKVYKTNDIDNVENCLKRFMKNKQYKKYKEFYQIDVEIITDLFKVCNSASLSAKKILNKSEQKGGYFIYIKK